MRVEFRNSMIHAGIVLSYMQLLQSDDDDNVLVSVGAWSNCREQGYHVSANGRAAVIAERRNSDGIRVIVGDAHQFDGQSHMPTDSLWGTFGEERSTDNTFDIGSEMEAAQTILRWLRGSKEVKKEAESDEEREEAEGQAPW